MLTHARPRDRATTAPAGASDARLGQVLALLERVLAEQTAQRALLERLEAPHRTGPHSTDIALLDAIASHVGPDIIFSAAELWRHAERVDDALRGAIGAAGVRDARGLGRRLPRLARHATGRVRLVCAGRDAEGKWWTVTVHRQD